MHSLYLKKLLKEPSREMVYIGKEMAKWEDCSRFQMLD